MSPPRTEAGVYPQRALVLTCLLLALSFGLGLLARRSDAGPEGDPSPAPRESLLDATRTTPRSPLEREWAEAEAKTLRALADAGHGIEPKDFGGNPSAEDDIKLAFAVLNELSKDQGYLLEDAFAIYGKPGAEQLGSDLPLPTQKKLLAEALAQADPARKFIERALTRERITLSTPWRDGPIPSRVDPSWVRPIRLAVALYVARACVARSAGRHDEAWEALAAALEVCARFRQPGFSGFLVRHGISKAALAGLGTVLGSGPPPSAKVRTELAELLAALDRDPPIHEMVRAELARSLGAFAGREPQEGYKLAAMGAGIHRPEELPIFSQSTTLQREWIARERASFVDRMARLSEIAAGDLAGLADRYDKLPLVDPQAGEVLASMGTPNLRIFAHACERFHALVEEWQAKLRAR